MRLEFDFLKTQLSKKIEYFKNMIIFVPVIQVEKSKHLY